jgi:glycosyltransferase involved in cell wall biosynthesis
MRPRILFVSHSASRNGASILLLHLLEWLRMNTDYELEVLMNGVGDLLEDFRSICKTRVRRNLTNIVEALPHPCKRFLQPLATPRYFSWRLPARYDLVYINTSAAWRHVPALSKCALALLWHIHELEYALGRTADRRRMEALFRLATRVVSVSQSVSEALMNRFNVPSEKVDLVHGFIPFPAEDSVASVATRKRIRRSLGWPDDAYIVGGCGAPGWRKGTDLFAQVARQLSDKCGDTTVGFLWVGGDTGGDEALRFAHDVDALGLSSRCRIVPNTPSVGDYYDAMDAFALTSREDPFPLVMLEAAARELPIVCFEHSGGAPEFVRNDAGLIAPYLDISSFAAHLNALRQSSDLRRTLGSAGARRVKDRHVVDVQAPHLLRSINHCLSRARCTLQTPGRAFDCS